jgi:uncharacterized protein (DUF2267 family)
MFGWFKKKPPTFMDQFITAIYGDPPPKKRADVETAIQLAYEDLLLDTISKEEIRQIATSLSEGPIPYSTHDLAISVALYFFKRIPAEDHEILFEVQLHARMKALGWAKEGKVVAPVLQIFEDTLYEYYEPVSA